jgi:hypothetical protein
MTAMRALIDIKATLQGILTITFLCTILLLLQEAQNMKVAAIGLLIKYISCLIVFSDLLAVAEQFLVVSDEIYLESYVDDHPLIVDRATSSKSAVITKSSRDTFFDVFSKFETYKTDRALWTSTQRGRRTLTNMKYTICPIWLADETNVPANIANMNAVMQKNKEFYQRMSWNQHEVTWDFLDDLKVVNFTTTSNPTRGNVADACSEYMRTVYGRTYPDTHTGLIVAYNPIKSGDLSWRGGVAVINYNITWMSLGFDFGVTRHELGHNYGHPHHSAYSYDWRFSRGFSSNVLDGFDMMSGGTYIDRMDKILIT